MFDTATRPRPPSGRQYELAAGAHRVTVVEVGGGLRSYHLDGRPVLDGYGTDETCSGGRGQLLIPWPNRLRDGRYRFGGADLQLPLTEPAKHNAIHGLIRWQSWEAAEQQPDRLVLRHTLHAQPGYPFELELAVEYALSARDGLSVTTSATNVGVAPCPFGAGAHPYLTLGAPAIDGATLQHPADTVLETDERSIPVGSRPVEGTPADFRAPRRIGDTRLDTAFTDLRRDADGRARVTLSGAGAAGASGAGAGAQVQLWMDDSFGYLMLFTGDSLDDPARRRTGLGVEPMTCAPNAFQSGAGLLVLEPGRTFRGAWGITPSGGDTAAAAPRARK